MAYDYSDDYGGYSNWEGYGPGEVPTIGIPGATPFGQQPAAAYSGGLTILGWAPNGSSWIPVYKGNNGQLYTGSTQNPEPWDGDPGQLKTGDGPAGQPTWAPNEPAPATASETYQESVARVNNAAVAPPPVVDSGGGSASGGAKPPKPPKPAIDPSLLAPWTENFRPPADAALPTYTPPAEFTYEDWQAPEAFKPLTAQDLLKDPGYLWRESRITSGLENTAAARGLLNSSGTLYNIGNAVSDFAGQEYGAANNRAWDQWQGNFDASLTGYTTNRNNAVNNYATNYGVGKDTYNLLTDRSEDVYRRAWDEFRNRQTTYRDNQRHALDNIYRFADLGSRAAAY